MEVLSGGKKPKPDYASLYINAAIRSAERLKEAPNDKQAKLRAIFYGVKLIVETGGEQKSLEEVQGRFWIIESIKERMKEITPRELMQMFPVEKVYDGQKWGSKDYFYTMDVLRKHGLDKPLGENVEEILYDYMNRDTMEFTVATMSAISAMRRYNGEKGLFEEFAEQQGMKLQTYTMTTDEKGRRWLTDSDAGERQRVKVKRPKYLRAI